MRYLRFVRPLKRMCRSIGLEYGFDDLGIQPRYPYYISSPAALDFSEAENVRYLGLCIDESREEEDYPWDEGSDERPLIYCSLGSQSYRYFPNAAARFLSLTLAAFLKRDDYRLILHIGVDRSPDEFGDLPSRIKVCSWAPQLAVLKRSAAAITTAGLGALKECVYSGVPMVALPGANDQPSNAARVVHHGLGVRGDLRRCTESDLLAMVDEVVGKPHYADNVRKMRTRCMDPGLFEAGVDSIMALAREGKQSHASENS